MKFLIDDWCKSWKMWSMRLSTLGATLMGLFIYFPDSALFMYNMMPKEVRELLPDRLALYIALFIFVGTAIARLVKQKKLHGDTKK